MKQISIRQFQQTICLLIGLSGLVLGILFNSIPMSIFGFTYVYIGQEDVKLNAKRA